MGSIEGAPANGVALALGFVYSYPEVDTAILGTGSAAPPEGAAGRGTGPCAEHWAPFD